MPSSQANPGPPRQSIRHHRHRQRGVAAILSMMFLVILASLAAAMAIVSQGNIATADSHIRINRALAAAETGMEFIIFRLRQATLRVTTTDGLVDASNAENLWDQIRDELLFEFSAEEHNDVDESGNPAGEPSVIDGSILHVGPIRLGEGEPKFRVTFTPHPDLENEDYDAPYYQRPPYDSMDPPVSSSNPLDLTWIRVRVEAWDGPQDREIVRSIQMDFRIEKKIRYALLSSSRVMIGRNVMIDGSIGSRFTEVHLENGHPIQMVSDFRGLNSSLDTDLNVLINTLALNDKNGDNRLNLEHESEVDGIDNPEALDRNSDGYIDDYDFFLKHFDANADTILTPIELDTATNVHAAQLLELIDTFGDPTRPGYNDGVIDNDDRYTKIRGEIVLTANQQDWLDGAANDQYQDYLQGPVIAEHDKAPLTFNATDKEIQTFGPGDFDVSSFRSMATGDLSNQATTQFGAHDPTDPASPNMDTSGAWREEVPYGSAHPYDYYDRPVYENMTFENVTIPKGTNALFKNCTFKGVTFVETTTGNADADYNFAGVTEADGTLKFPDLHAVVDLGAGPIAINDTKSISNNVRFDGCTFEGNIVSDTTERYTHIRNKITFTGRTQFKIETSEYLNQSSNDHLKQAAQRSTILAPHYSVEMGSFTDPTSTTETVNLSGTIVAGVIDIRGQAKLRGTILTTFEPISFEAPVIGETSPQFNTTLGYFPSGDGDLEAELPSTGVGVIQIVYDPTLALPDGIVGAVDLTPLVASYFEGGAQ